MLRVLVVEPLLVCMVSTMAVDMPNEPSAQPTVVLMCMVRFDVDGEEVNAFTGTSLSRCSGENSQRACLG